MVTDIYWTTKYHSNFLHVFFLFKQSIVSSKVHMLVSLSCVSSETHNLQPLFLRIYGTEGGSMCQAFLVETVETGNNNFRAFPKRVSPRILSLESVDCFGTSAEHY